MNKYSKHIRDYKKPLHLHSKEYKNYSCIYCIYNKVNGKKYIGSTRNFKKRSETHLYRLRHGLHCNRYLQRSFNKYKEDNFEFIFCQSVLYQICPTWNSVL